MKIKGIFRCLVCVPFAVKLLGMCTKGRSELILKKEVNMGERKDSPGGGDLCATDTASQRSRRAT